MRRTLSTVLFPRMGLFGGSPPSHVFLSAAKRSVFAVGLCQKSTSEPGSMDLSNMRKKYKGDEEVRGSQLLGWSCLYRWNA